VAKIERDFDDPGQVMAVLESLESLNNGQVTDRTYRSIVFLAGGSKVKLGHYMGLALRDYRDLYWQAEYENPEVRKYDFSRPFDEQGL